MTHHWTSGIVARRQAWHGLARVMRDGFTFRDQEAEEEDYTVERKPLVYCRKYEYQGMSDYEPAGYDALVTPDFSPAVHGIVSDRYHIVQPKTVRLLAADMVDRIPGASAETSIVLRQGRDAVYCVGLGKSNGSGEEYTSFLTVHSPYDGSTAVGVSATTVATVCWNTLQRAHQEHRVRIHHTSVVAGEIERALAVASSAVWEAQLYGEAMLPLVRARLTTQAERVRAVRLAAQSATGIYALPDDHAERIKAERKLARMATLIVDRIHAPQGQSEVREGTAYGVLQATYDALEYSGRVERNRGAKLASVLAGDGAEVQGRVQSALVEVYG